MVRDHTQCGPFQKAGGLRNHTHAVGLLPAGARLGDTQRLPTWQLCNSLELKGTQAFPMWPLHTRGQQWTTRNELPALRGDGSDGRAPAVGAELTAERAAELVLQRKCSPPGLS